MSVDVQELLIVLGVVAVVASVVYFKKKKENQNSGSVPPVAPPTRADLESAARQLGIDPVGVSTEDLIQILAEFKNK